MRPTRAKGGVVVVVIALAVSGCWANNPVKVTSGQVNPEFRDVKFGRFIVSAVNVPEDFRKELEKVTAIRIAIEIGRLKKQNWREVYGDATVEFRNVFPDPAFQPEKKYDVQFIMDKIHQRKLDVIVLINMLNEGGQNIEDVESYVTVLQHSGNYIHDMAPVKRYRFAKIILFDAKTGKQVWKGDGTVKAKPGTTDWYHDSAVTLASDLVEHLESAGVLRE
jgi:hypothetical protein